MAVSGLLTMAGCAPIPTIRGWADPLIGQSVQVLKDLNARPQSYSASIGWQEHTYTLPSGHWVWVQPDRVNCELHFEIDGEDRIVGYRPVGRGCAGQ